MAVTITRYNHTAARFAGGNVDLAALKFMLLSDAATFTATNTALTDVTNAGAYQVSGNGWAAGGELLANAAVTTVATNGAMLDADDIAKEAVGGSIGPAFKAVIFDDTADAPLWFIDFDGEQTAGEGTEFRVTINALGIFRITNPA